MCHTMITDVLADDPVDQVEWKLQQDEPPSPMTGFGISLRSFLDPRQRVADLGTELSRSCVTSFDIPVCS
jgi:hypothetical protein